MPLRRTIAAVMILGAAVATPAAAEPFTFMALGDMPYVKTADVHPPYVRLIEAINQSNPDFAIHVGDIKSGSAPCSDAILARQKAYFDSFTGAVVLTPGDNEWTDCHREAAGSMDPLERLAKVREMFFPTAMSLGQAPIRLTRQADVSEFADMVENARWMHNEVMFATLHVVGSNNNFETRDPNAAAEFFARDAANLAWIADTFAEAGTAGAKAVVLAMQADMWVDAPNGRFGGENGFKRTYAALVAAAEAFAKPVLLIHGDSHILVVDQPFKGRSGSRLDNMIRLQVFGASDVHAVQVTVDPDALNMFAFRPFYGPGNLRNLR